MSPFIAGIVPKTMKPWKNEFMADFGLRVGRQAFIIFMPQIVGNFCLQFDTDWPSILVSNWRTFGHLFALHFADE